MTAKLSILMTVSLLACATTAPAHDPIFKDNNDIAIKGYDPVAYFTASKPVPGKPELSTRHGHATWHFSSAENQALFEKSPDKYLPQYGGYCAWAVSQGNLAPVDPNMWKVVGSKLYLNYNAAVKEKWEQDQGNLIKKADELWPTVKKKAKK